MSYTCQNCCHRGLFVVIMMIVDVAEDTDPCLQTVRVECRRYAPQLPCTQNAVTTFPLQSLDDNCGDWGQRE